MKIIVAHPGQQHSYRLASAVKKQDALLAYMTTYYAKANKRAMFDNKSELATRAAKRRCEALADEDVVVRDKLLFFMVAFLLRYDRSKKLYRAFNDLLSNHFGKKVARYAIRHGADAVVMYDTSSLKCFEILEKKAPHILRIQDVAAINRVYMKEVYAADMERSPAYADTLMKERGFLFQEKNLARWKKEIELSQFFLAPSEIVKRSLTFSGAKEEQIFLCPYGANLKASDAAPAREGDGRLNILYVGNVTQMKGIFYLLDAVMELPEDEFSLTVVGMYHAEDPVWAPYRDRIHFAGYVLHEKVADYYARSDVFVFPSLGDSFGLSVLEAMKLGLPVICSDHAGSADAIRDGENGFVVPVGSKEAIKEKLLFCKQNPEWLASAKKKAVETADVYTWSRYDECISNMLEQINHE